MTYTKKNHRRNAINIIDLLGGAIQTEIGVRTIKFLQEEVNLFCRRIIKTIEQNSKRSLKHVDTNRAK